MGRETVAIWTPAGAGTWREWSFVTAPLLGGVVLGSVRAASGGCWDQVTGSRRATGVGRDSYMSKTEDSRSWVAPPCPRGWSGTLSRAPTPAPASLHLLPGRLRALHGPHPCG